MNNDRRSRKPTLHERLDHLFYLLWKRNEKMKCAMDHLHELIHAINERTMKMAGEVERIESEVTEISGAVDSAVALLAKLADLIRNNAGDPARLNKIADDLDAKSNALAAAVVANDPDTPPAP